MHVGRGFGKIRQMLVQAPLIEITSLGKTHVTIVATAQRFENSTSSVVGIIIFLYIAAISLEGLVA